MPNLFLSISATDVVVGAVVAMFSDVVILHGGVATGRVPRFFFKLELVLPSQEKSTDTVELKRSENVLA